MTCSRLSFENENTSEAEPDTATYVEKQMRPKEAPPRPLLVLKVREICPTYSGRQSAKAETNICPIGHPLDPIFKGEGSSTLLSDPHMTHHYAQLAFGLICEFASHLHPVLLTPFPTENVLWLTNIGSRRMFKL